MSFWVLGGQTAQSKRLLVGLEVKGLCCLGKIGEEIVSEYGDRKGDDAVNDEGLRPIVSFTS